MPAWTAAHGSLGIPPRHDDICRRSVGYLCKASFQRQIHRYGSEADRARVVVVLGPVKGRCTPLRCRLQPPYPATWATSGNVRFRREEPCAEWPDWAQSGRERNGDSDGEKRPFVRHSADVPTPQLAREWTNCRVLANFLPAESGKCSKPFSHGASSGAPIRLLLHRGALSMDGFERVVPTRFSGGDRLRLEVEPFPDKRGF